MSTSGDASPRTVADQEWDASRLAEAALVGEPRDSLGLLLRTVAEMCGALGCVLWRANADADPWADPPRGKMSMLAGWFDTKFSPQLLAINKLQFEGASVAGKAVRSRKPAWSNDLVADKNPNAQQPFFTHHNITRTLAAPISYANRRVGAVNIYRRETSPAFSRADGALLARIAQLLPHLYRAVRHRAGFQLVLDVGEILRNHQRRPERATDPRTCQKRTLEQLCIALQKMFQCVEASVFLEAEGRPGIFTCACTTSQWPSADRVRQQEYSATFHDGFSGLALRTGEGFRVYDTQDCEDDVRDFQAKYPEFTGRKSRGLSNDVNTWLKVPEGWERPLPHSLIIAPLVVGQKTYGFLRCWVAEKGPPFFSLDDLELLRLIGEQFTHAVESWHEEIGVFASLSKARQDASTAKEEAMKAHREHRMDLENIHHQMKGPLWEAKRRIDDMLEELPRPPSPRELFAVRSMLHRSSLMSKKIGWLTKLDKGESLPVRATGLDPTDVVRLAGEICENNQVRVSEKRNIKIEFNADSIFNFAPVNLRADLDLLSEALHNLMDNAIKYSYSNTRIRLFAGRGRGGRFYLAVTNVGVPIEPHEVSECRKRLWRGPTAERTAGEGSGLGLWIADHIMKALGGELQIIPTRPNDGVTEVRLAFSFG